jgi:hypothetical protein
MRCCRQSLVFCVIFDPMKKAFPFLVLFVLAVTAISIRRCRQPGSAIVSNNNTHAPADNTNRDNGFDRRASLLEYTHHARCRMECRHITEEEVKDILQNGNINYRKSEANGMPCPTYALEGYTHQDNQHVRIVFAQCDNSTKVVTCIDLDVDYECHCPGDGNKHER